MKVFTHVEHSKLHVPVIPNWEGEIYAVKRLLAGIALHIRLLISSVVIRDTADPPRH